LTSAPTSELVGVWLKDGATLVFSADRSGPPRLFTRDSSSGSERELLAAGGLQMANDVSPDGNVIVFTERGRAGADLLLLPLSGTDRPTPFIATRANESDARFSPDGSSVAFVSDESGRSEVYVAPRDAPGARTPVSTSGARSPRWNRATGDLHFLAANGDLMSVSVSRGKSSPEIGVARRVDTARTEWPWHDFDITPDGQRFLAIVPQVMANEHPLTIILNWLPHERP
jgi:Tol biopolymer transport system component